MKAGNNKLALARKVIERRIRHDKQQTVAEILYSELHRRVDAAREALRPLGMRLDELYTIRSEWSINCMANDIVIGELRERLSEVIKTTKAYIVAAEAVDAAIKAELRAPQTNGGEA